MKGGRQRKKISGYNTGKIILLKARPSFGHQKADKFFRLKIIPAIFIPNISMHTYPLQHTGHSEYSRGRHFIFVCVYGVEQILSCIIEAFSNITEPLCVGSPQHYHLCTK